MGKKKKTFVLDTNVILHDYKSIFSFEENDIVISLTTIEEIDKHKKGNEAINFNARKFIKDFDALREANPKQEDRKYPLGKGLGTISISIENQIHETILNRFIKGKDDPDHRILSTVLYLQEKNPKDMIVFVTKDVNLRIKADSIGIQVEDYETDKVQDVSVLNMGTRTIEDSNFEEIIETLYKENTAIISEDAFKKHKFTSNECLTLKNCKQSVLVRVDSEIKQFIKIREKTERVSGIEARNKEQQFALNILLDEKIPLVALTGKAGTGKTLVALAAALEKIKTYNQIFLARPIVPLSNRDLGFLPGDVNDKISPYMLPLFDNLGVIKNAVSRQEEGVIEEMLKDERLLITPLAYIRGRSLSSIFFIVDEAQNLTPHEVKTIITRAGEGTKIIFTGDIEQIDSPYLDKKSNGLSYLIDRMNNEKVFAHVHLKQGERSHLAEVASQLL